MLCNIPFHPYSLLKDNEFKQTATRNQAKFTLTAKAASSNADNFIKTVNSEGSITKHFNIKDLNSTFNDIDKPFSLFHLNINALSFQSDELESLISKSKITLK